MISLSDTVHARQRTGEPAPGPEELTEIASREGYGIGEKHRAGTIVLGIDFDPARLNDCLRCTHQEQPRLRRRETRSC